MGSEMCIRDRVYATALARGELKAARYMAMYIRDRWDKQKGFWEENARAAVIRTKWHERAATLVNVERVYGPSALKDRASSHRERSTTG